MKKLIVILILSFAIGSLVAQDEISTNKRKIPSLNGHSFPSMINIQNSFITTSLRADIGLGETSKLRVPGLKIGDYEVLAFEGQILFINADISYKQRFNDWLALFFTMKVAGRLGTDMSTILADGVNTIGGGEIGWLIRIMHSDKLNLSTRVYIQNLGGNFINVSEYFEDLINDVPNPQVYRKIPAMSVGASVQGAYAISRVFGLQFHVQYAFGESFNRDEPAQSYASIGLLGDVDFNPVHKVPIGLGLGYTLSSAPDVLMLEGGYANILMGKLAYTGAEDFELGLQYTFYKLSLDNAENNPSLSTLILGLNFYF